MSDSERARVGQALDLIRDALASYVDAAMAEAYGQAWDQVVAKDNAKRRPNGREFPVFKRDLVVLLQAIMHRRIEPWSRLTAYPRARAFASEVLSLRHLHHHGDDCQGEYARLLDTGTRLLSLLELAVPLGLKPPGDAAEQVPLTLSAAAEPHPPVPTDLIDAEVSRLGETGAHLVEILTRALTLPSTFRAELRDAITTHDPDQDADTVQRLWEEASSVAGARVVELMDEVNQLEADREEPADELLGVLVLWARCELSDGLLGVLALHHAETLRLNAVNEITQRLQEGVSDVGKGGAAAEGRVPELPVVDELAVADRIRGFVSGHSQRWDELIRLASRLDETSPLANFVVARANLQMADSSKDAEGGWTSEALPFVRDAVARLRLAAGWEPGSISETALVSALRLEGEICNDLGRTDEAVQAFARADEVIDRYPAADPSLRT